VDSRGDFFDTSTLHSRQCNLLELVIVEALEEPAVLFRQLCSHLWRRLLAQNVFQGCAFVCSTIWVGNCSCSSAAFLSFLVTREVRRFAGRNDYQQPPKSLAIEQLGKTATSRVATETIKGTQGHILFICDSARHAA
jgi:hypothetical protein